jgi:hypothetical protein
MQLITKLLKDKPITLGVKYASEQRAIKKYGDFHSYEKNSFHAEIEIENQERLNLTLISDSGERFEYLSLEYNPTRLKNFFTYVKPKTEFTFVHFYQHLDNELIAEDRYRKQKFVKVKGYTLKQEN